MMWKQMIIEGWLQFEESNEFNQFNEAIQRTCLNGEGGRPFLWTSNQNLKKQRAWIFRWVEREEGGWHLPNDWSILGGGYQIETVPLCAHPIIGWTAVATCNSRDIEELGAPFHRLLRGTVCLPLSVALRKSDCEDKLPLISYRCTRL